ncbi:MAG: hypothetical protein IPL35_11980 [Sphingobacteriales bacterium]|nr:hypothetical protein [Sphingobacteriales bacterium]
MKNRIEHDCNECMDNVYRLLDGDCSPMQQTMFLKNLSACPRCMEKYEREKHFREFIKTSLPKKCLSQQHINIIKRNINEHRS